MRNSGSDLYLVFAIGRTVVFLTRDELHGRVGTDFSYTHEEARKRLKQTDFGQCGAKPFIGLERKQKPKSFHCSRLAAGITTFRPLLPNKQTGLTRFSSNIARFRSWPAALWAVLGRSWEPLPSANSENRSNCPRTNWLRGVQLALWNHRSFWVFLARNCDPTSWDVP